MLKIIFLYINLKILNIIFYFHVNFSYYQKDNLKKDIRKYKLKNIKFIQNFRRIVYSILHFLMNNLIFFIN